MSALPRRNDKIVPLPTVRARTRERTSWRPPQLRAEILRVMAGKARELGTMLQPFTETTRPPIAESLTQR